MARRISKLCSQYLGLAVIGGALCAAALAGCGDSGLPDEAPEATFGGAGAKADGQFSECQLAEVLKLVNESGTNAATLTLAGVGSQAAAGILAHRLGPDGMPGTADDNLFDDLKELDDILYVGPVTLSKLSTSVNSRCELDLATRPFIDANTFAGQPGWSWSRDNQEIESVLGVQGITGQQLRALLLTPDSTGRTLLQKVRKSKAMEGFSYSYGPDEMPWDKDRHQAREALPYIALTIESGRFEPEPVTGARELSLGTDLNDDTYFDTPGYTLLAQAMELRSRARWDTPTLVRRLLVQAKFGTEIDDAGNKIDNKVDVRTDSGDKYVKTLDDDVRRGLLPWDGAPAPAIPVRGVYEALGKLNLLPDLSGHQKVLLLDPKAHLRSTRARYHLNEAYIDDVVEVYTKGAERIQEMLDLAKKARAAGLVSAADEPRVAAMETLGQGILDKSLIAQQAGVAVADLVLPDQFKSTEPKSIAELEQHQKVAEVVSQLYHQFADADDDVDRIVTGTTDESLSELADQFRAWQISLNKELAKKTVFEPILTIYNGIAEADRPAQMAAFNAFGMAQQMAAAEGFGDFRPVDDNGWKWIGLHLQEHAISVGQKQIEGAGTAAQALWFDMARRFYVPESYRTSSNFIIDTTDLTEMISHEEWESIPEAERTFEKPLAAEKIFNTTFVNETQIELGSEEPYVNRVKELTEKLAMNPNDADTQAMLAGAKFVFDQYKNALKVVVQVKGDAIISRLRKAGAPNTITWAAPSDSKGNIALRILADRK